MRDDNQRQFTQRQSDKDIADIKTQLAVLIGGQDRIEELLKEHHVTLYGDDQKDTPGLKTKVDRLQQSKISNDFFAKTGFTAAVGVVIKMVYDWAFHGK